VILLDCVSKMYCVLLPLICSDISCFSWPYKSGPSIALCIAWQLRCCTSSSSRFLIFLLIILYAVFLDFPLPSVSPNIKFLFIESELCLVCPKYFNLLNVAKVSRECLCIIYLVTDAFIFSLSMVSSAFLLSAFICTNTTLLERLLSTVA
jgi:hypothetical protein